MIEINLGSVELTDEQYALVLKAYGECGTVEILQEAVLNEIDRLIREARGMSHLQQQLLIKLAQTVAA
jgi:hypothetical protein